MPPPLVPSLQLNACAPPHSGFASARNARAHTPGSALQLSARHLLKPKVGTAAMSSATGVRKPAWEQWTPRSCATWRSSLASEDGEDEPYHVGRSRLKQQLHLAMNTSDEASQLRRLESTLQTPAARYEQSLIHQTSQAANQTMKLMKRLKAFGDPKVAWTNDPFGVNSTRASWADKSKKKSCEKDVAGPRETSQDDTTFDEYHQMAALMIQKKYRGNKDREEIARMRAETFKEPEVDIVEDESTTAAATKIQSRYRGKKDRAQVAAKVNKIKEEQTAAATQIQAKFRGKHAREQVNKQREEETAAATTIQSRFRGGRSRKNGQAA